MLEPGGSPRGSSSVRSLIMAVWVDLQYYTYDLFLYIKGKNRVGDHDTHVVQFERTCSWQRSLVFVQFHCHLQRVHATPP